MRAREKSNLHWLFCQTEKFSIFIPSLLLKNFRSSGQQSCSLNQSSCKLRTIRNGKKKKKNHQKRKRTTNTCANQLRDPLVKPNAHSVRGGSSPACTNKQKRKENKKAEEPTTPPHFQATRKWRNSQSGGTKRLESIPFFPCRFVQ